MRFDLIANTMFKTAMIDGQITINNPAIWRPIVDIRDTCTAFLRAVQADQSIAGVFNVAGGNYTVGQVGEVVKEELEQLTGQHVRVDMKAIHDFRNYKVSTQKASTCLGFAPKYSLANIVASLFTHREEYGNYAAEEYYNIRVLERLATAVPAPKRSRWPRRRHSLPER
jgi:nucleoside-diphosphate-sugar epimerase